MSISCPYCKAGLNSKGIKAGRYTPKCPKCGKQFVLIAPKDAAGKMLVKQIDPPKKQKAIPDTIRVPAVKSNGALATDCVPVLPKGKGKANESEEA